MVLFFTLFILQDWHSSAQPKVPYFMMSP